MTTLRIAVTADLHYGHNPRGDLATELLHDFLLREPPDLLLLGGDIGTDRNFAECLGLFSDLPCRKALVPGNHDVWVEPDDHRGDSLRVYQNYLPDVCAAFDVHYLDRGPLVLDGGLAVVGSMNWYDYSWSLPALRERLPDWEERLRTKRFSRGRHNDARFVRWALDDVSFTGAAVAALADHLRQALDAAEQVLVMTHHPAFRAVSFPAPPDETEDSLLWAAFSGNAAVEELLAAHAGRVPLVFSGHTHCEREGRLGDIRGYNVGGDYQFKRLLVIDWPGQTVQGHTFEAPGAAEGG